MFQVVFISLTDLQSKMLEQCHATSKPVPVIDLPLYQLSQLYRAGPLLWDDQLPATTVAHSSQNGHLRLRPQWHRQWPLSFQETKITPQCVHLRTREAWTKPNSCETTLMFVKLLDVRTLLETCYSKTDKSLGSHTSEFCFEKLFGFYLYTAGWAEMISSQLGRVTNGTSSSINDLYDVINNSWNILRHTPGPGQQQNMQHATKKKKGFHTK